MACTRVICGNAGVDVLETVVLDEDGSAKDISSADTIEVRVYRPDGSTEDRTASLSTDGTDGRFKYALVADDTSPSGTDVPGTYRWRSRLVINAESIDAWSDDQFFTAESLG